MKRSGIKLICLVFFCCLIANLSPSLQAGQTKQQAKKKRVLNVTQLLKKLSPRNQNWYDLVTHIISETEERIFFQLENDKERDAFIGLFWKMRDPSPENEENEFQLEHLKRFNYASRRFKYGTARKGWQTDMGKIHIILGAPQSIDRYEDERVIEPIQIWSYYGVRRPGLPNAFNLLFWKRGSVGEYKMYNPQADGPFALLKKNLETHKLDPFDFEAVYRYISEYSQIVAMASLSLIPNEPTFNYTPSLQSSILLTKVETFPQEKINTRYARDFLNYRGIVQVDYASSYMECSHQVHVAKNPETGLNFVHFSLLPKSVSVSHQLEQGQFVFSFKVTVNLKKEKKTIFSYTKNFPFKADSEEAVRRQFEKGVIISDYFPVPQGNYKLEVLIQNPVKGEFSYFDQAISVPAETLQTPVLLGPILTYEVKRNPSLTFAPYKFMDYEVTLNPRFDFGKKDPLIVFLGVERGNYTRGMKVNVVVEDIFEREKYFKNYNFIIDEGRKFAYFSQKLEQLPPGNYTIAAKVSSVSGTLLVMKDFRFQVSLNNNVARPTLAKKITPMKHSFIQYHILGLQYMRLQQIKKAEVFMKRAFSLNPKHPQVIKDYCGLLLNKKEFDKILQIVEALKGNDKLRFDYHAIRGKVFYFKEQYLEAIKQLQIAVKIYDSDIGVLNFLGYSYFKIKKMAEAREAFSASLEVNSNQAKIKQILKQISTSK